MLCVPNIGGRIRKAGAAYVIILLMWGSVAVASPVTSQKPQATEQEQLWQIVEQVNSDTRNLLESGVEPAKINQLLTSDCEGMSYPEKMHAASLLAEAEALEDNKGLDLRGGYTFGNQSGGLDNEDGNAYLELNWNVLRGGYQFNKDKAIATRNHAEVARLSGELNHFKRMGQCRRLAITNSFISLRSALLQNKLALMKPVYKVERRAYFKGWSFLDDLLVSESDLHNAGKALQRLNSPELMGKGDVLSSAYNFPVIDIDLAAVIRAIQADERGEELLNARRLAARYDAKAKDEDDRLRFFVRKNFANNSGGLEDDGVVAGVRFIMPLSKKPDTVLDYRVKEIDDEHEVDSWRRVAKTRLAYIELHEQLERVIEQHFRFLRSSERLRRSLVSKDVLLDETDLATAIIRARAMLDAGLELVKAKEELYQRVNEVFYQAQLAYDPAYIKHTSLPGENYRARKAQRSLYVWSATFNSQSNKRLWQFIETKGIQRVILSGGRKTDKDKLREFISAATRKKIDVGLMVGANEWIFGRNHPSAIPRAAQAAELTGHLHLDVEPHTLPLYKKYRRNYINAYISLIEGVRQKLEPEDKLTISVPVHWEKDDYARLARLADDLFIMSYEMKDFSRIEKRLAPIMAVLPAERVTIALRPQDFADEWALEQVITKLIERFGIQRVALHDAKTYMAMPVTEQ